MRERKVMAISANEAVCQCERGVFIICYLCINHFHGKIAKTIIMTTMDDGGEGETAVAAVYWW